jgi:predicted metal-binding membrane protein
VQTLSHNADIRNRHAGMTTAATGSLDRRQRLLIATCIAIVCILAWGYLIRLNQQMSSAGGAEMSMRDMGMATNAPWGVADILFTFAMWTVMMIGMMTPSATPVLMVFTAWHVRRSERGISIAVLAFGLGYLVVWAGFSLLATLAQWALHQAALLSPMMSATSPRLAGAIIIAAGIYQLTPFKHTCLSHCQTPIGFLMSHWRDGTGGAFRMGLQHGIYCVGCCWVLMCVLFAVGVMNLVWVAVLTAFILVEKLGIGGDYVPRIGGALLIVAGVVMSALGG